MTAAVAKATPLVRAGFCVIGWRSFSCHCSLSVMDPLTAMKQQSQQHQQGGGPPGAPLQTYLGSSLTPATAAPSNPLASAHPLAANPLANNPLARAASPQPASSIDPLRAASPLPAPVATSVRQPAPSAQPAAGGGVGERVPVTPSHDPLAATVRQQAPTARPPQPAASTFSFAPSYNPPPSGSPASTPAAAASTPYSSAQSLTSPLASPTAIPRPTELSEEQRLDSELRAFFGGDLPPTKQDELKADRVSKDEAGIVTLAEAGKWREVVKLCEQLLQLPAASAPSTASPSFLTTTAAPPHTVLRYHSYLVSALLKLKRTAEAHLALTRVGPFFSPDKLYQSYSEQYGGSGREGSMVPFVLHLSRAEVGYYEGDVKKTVDALYGLREYVAATVAKRADEERAGKQHEESADDWRERYCTVCSKLAEYYMMLTPPDYISAVHVLATLLSPSSAASTAALSSAQQETVWYQLGRVHLQAGNVDSAASCFSSAAALSATPTSASTSALHQSLIHLSTGQYTDAQHLLAPYLNTTTPPPSPSLVNNYALACLYVNELSEARRAVESYVREEPGTRVDGGLLAVLRVLYDIGNMGVRKKLVEALALMYGSDELEIV